MTHKMDYRVKQLLDRNGAPLVTFSSAVDVLTDKVAVHLKAMSLEWAL